VPDVAGTVTVVGPSVTRFKVRDHVDGLGKNTFADAPWLQLASSPGMMGW
jgi:NADPH:quinone reductase-like Zn-dependent oxidoreductase